MDVFFDVLILLVIACGVHLLAKRFSLPYTILLFVVGILLIPLSQAPIPVLHNINLTPELLFYVFLPVLIFESAYQINYHQLIKNKGAIWLMATLGLSLSTAVIAGLGYLIFLLIGRDVPVSVLVLFGIIISATDPVAVLSIFKQLGVPRRLSLLIEGESLFNDGTSVALFLIVLGLLQSGEALSPGVFFEGIWMFVSMVIGGMIIGSVMGILFAKSIKYIKNNEAVEVTLTMILAHATFIIAELATEHTTGLYISGVIATAYAGLIMGNYGKTKISPNVERYMHKFWEFFAFITNSLVFLLMGLLLADINIPLSQIWLPLLIAILIVVIARAISIYIPIGGFNMLTKAEKIPLTRQHVMAWGSLRGSLAIVLVLLIPDGLTVPGRDFGFTIKDFILAITIAVIVFSLLVKGLTIKPLIHKLGLNKLLKIEVFEKIESEILIYRAILQKIEKLVEDYQIAQENYESLHAKYSAKLEESHLSMQIFVQQTPQSDKRIQKSLSLHALGIERQYLKEMFAYNEINEYEYLHLSEKIAKQELRVEKGLSQIIKTPTKYLRKQDRILGCIHYLQKRHDKKDVDTYIVNRARYIIADKVSKALIDLQAIDFGYDKELLTDVVSLYKGFHDVALARIEDVKEKNPEKITAINRKLLNKGLMKTEERLIQDLFAKDMITHTLYESFKEEIEREVLKDCHMC